MNAMRWGYFLFLCFVVSTAGPVAADEEQKLIAILQSNAGAPQKCAACAKLRIMGTARSVPALASLLQEERTAHAARYALESLPGPEAGGALRRALAKSPGPIQIGLLDSLGWRREPETVALLKDYLADSNTAVASMAATALGRVGNNEAVAALQAAAHQAPRAVRPAVLESLLKCAEKQFSGGQTVRAAAIYRDLYLGEYPPTIRAAAWRGLALSDPGQMTDFLTKALSGSDRSLQTAAVKLIQEVDNPGLLRSCLRLWPSLPMNAQLALLHAHLKLGPEALTTIRVAGQSPHPAVRVAAWQALAHLNLPATVPELARAAARGPALEREAARNTLARLHGPEMAEAFRNALRSADPPVQAELLRALGERGDTGAAGVLLQHAGASTKAVRQAALESLRKLAVEDSINPLLNLVRQAQSDADREAILKALYACCRAAPNKDRTTRQVLEIISRSAPGLRPHLLTLLGALATPDALAGLEKMTRDEDVELAKEAIRVLSRWPNALPGPDLLALARTTGDATRHALALNGFIEVTVHESDLARRLDLLCEALKTARRVEEKRQTLGRIGQIPTRSALEAVLPYLADAAIGNEAAAAIVNIGDKLAATDPKPVAQAAAQVLAHCKTPEIVRRAALLRSLPKGKGPFLRDWLVCGPYTQQGITGALNLFPIAFGPEKPGEKVVWKAVPAADLVNLGAILPGQVDCVAYLQTQVIAPQDCEALLLLGSDDGVKAWLNGGEVHSNNIDRGAVPDQDTAPIKLKKGVNVLLLKITQGGGGWVACARIVGLDGEPIAGLRVRRPEKRTRK